MTPEEFYAVIQALRWKQYEMADWLGLDRHTVQHYLKGRRAIPKPTARLLRVLARYGAAIEGGPQTGAEEKFLKDVGAMLV